MAGPGEHPSAADRTQARVTELMDETRAHAKEAIHSTARRGRDIWDDQKRLLAVEVDGYACALRGAARTLHDQQQDFTARYVEYAADGLNHFAQNLREKDLDDALGRMGDFARRQPALFLGGAAAAGFLLSRFLKSSDGEHHSQPGAPEFTETYESASTDVERASENEPRGAADVEHPYTAADVETPVVVEPPRENLERPGERRP